ncbi:MAG: ParA family protein [Chloroflexi bacterium]|nr:ParA family protein [Chloroflexota bacterium]
MSRIFVMTNHKGGTGKSTSATNVAFGLTQVLRQINAPKQRVLLIDTDSQSHATLVTTGQADYGREESLYTVLMAERQAAASVMMDCITVSHWDDNLHVLPASPLLEGAERELIGVPGAPYRLAHPLHQISQHYAAVVIDTRPSFSLMTETALLAATDALIPIEPRYLESVGLQSVINKINDIREGWRHQALQVNGIIVTKMDKRVRGHVELLESLQEHQVLGQLIRGVIPVNEAVAYAHLSVFEYDARCAASQAYAELVGELGKQMFARAGA